MNGIVVLPLYTGGQPHPVGDARLVVAHVNMQGMDGDLGAFERAVRRRRPDLIVVLEAAERWRRELRGALPAYRLFTSGHGDVGLARVPVTLEQASADLGREARPFRVRLADRAVHLLALHTPSPITPGRARERDRELGAAGAWAAHTGARAVVFGDLNATPCSNGFRDLERTGHLRDSLDGFGLEATWPAALGPLGIPIDHLLYSDGLTVVRRSPGPSFGSAHRSLWVTLAPA